MRENKGPYSGTTEKISLSALTDLDEKSWLLLRSDAELGSYRLEVGSFVQMVLADDGQHITISHGIPANGTQEIKIENFPKDGLDADEVLEWNNALYRLDAIFKEKFGDTSDQWSEAQSELYCTEICRTDRSTPVAYEMTTDEFIRVRGLIDDLKE